MTKLVPCPFSDTSGQRCKGHIIRVEEYHNSDICWEFQPNGTWRFRLREAVLGEPVSYYRLFCSETHNRSLPDSDQMKFCYEDLGNDVRQILSVS
jgi:hypothetical protein